MGKQSKFLGAIKRLFTNSNPEDKELKTKPKKKWSFGKSKSDVGPSNPVEERNSDSTAAVLAEEIKEIKQVGFDPGQNKHAYSVALASAVAAEAAAVAAQAAAEVVRLTAASTSAMKQPTARSREELAAVKIQTAFRAYLARRAMRELRGVVRLKTLVSGDTVKRQTESTLKAMQKLAGVQIQVHTWRAAAVEDKKAAQKQMQQKSKQELRSSSSSSKLAEDWNLSHKSKLQAEADLQMKQQAAIRRERTLAYAFSHQWRNSLSARTGTWVFADPGNPEWGWSWLQRCELIADQETDARTSLSSIRSSGLRLAASAPRDGPTSTKTPPVPQKPNRTLSRQTSVNSRVRPASPKSTLIPRDDDAGSIASVRSEMPRRRSSIAGSLFRDDVSLTSTPPLPSYMHPTESTRAKERLRSPAADKDRTLEWRPPSSSTKKRLSFLVTDSAATTGRTSPAAVS